MYLCVVYAPSLEITVKGGKHVRHHQGLPYTDKGADLTLAFTDGTSKPEHVEAVPNTVPSGFEAPGQYEVEYEAFAPGCKCCGCEALASASPRKRVRAIRIVEIGLYVLMLSDFDLRLYEGVC